MPTHTTASSDDTQARDDPSSSGVYADMAVVEDLVTPDHVTGM